MVPRLLVALLIILLPIRAAAQDGLTVFAAASLTEVMTTLGQEWEGAGNPPVRFSFAGTSTLARQIEAGAPADLFFSADTEWMRHLTEQGLVAPGGIVDPIGNRLVMIAPDRDGDLPDDPFLLLTDLLQSGARLAVADPAHVPAGRYARAALQSIGLWDAMSSTLARTDNVRGALALVGRGEAPLGIVYATDASVGNGVQIVHRFPETSHPPIRYPFAMLGSSERPEAAQAFLDWIITRDAVFRVAGFKVLN